MASDKPKIDDIYLAALEKAQGEERGAFLDEVCGSDSALRTRVERLLSVQPKVGSFLESPAPGINVSHTLDQPLTEKPGTQIGPYKLLEPIGQGGMGAVYLAEQAEPVRRRVALKIVKPGMDTHRVIKRFEAERQALALMDHPSIAKVFDAGATETGRPYFVMEWVKGVPITQYCDEHQLTPRERLEIFTTVCQAVQHSHQKGIIHRDIKPSNVLVSESDGRPIAKVIDFGLAKAMGPELVDKTVFTQQGQILGTVEYMSPEQADLNPVDVDTRTDIYSLGVLLYELLTGETPFDRTRLRSAAFNEILRIIREEEPPKPSLKLSSSEAIASIAANRHCEPKKLGTTVRGELDWIVMKALEKDRTRRYETANGLASDIKRYLNDEAVEACPPSVGYRFRKFARRNLAAMATTSAIAAALIIGILGTTWQAIQATKERDRAEAAEAMSQAALLQTKEAESLAQKAREEAEDAASTAVSERNHAKEQKDLAQQQHYISELRLAWHDWQAGQLGRLRETLDQFIPGESSQDRRGWEWHFIHALMKRASLVIDDERLLRARTLCVSPDRDLLAVGGVGGVVIYEPFTWDVVSHLPSNAPVIALAFHPDGQEYAVIDEVGTLRIWAVSQGANQEPKTRIQLPNNSPRTDFRGSHIDWSPDGELLAVSSREKVHVCSAENGDVIKTLNVEPPVYAVRWSPDGQSLAVLLTYVEERLHLFKRDSWEVSQTIKTRGESFDICWSPDGQQIASTTYGARVIQSWDAKSGKHIRDFRGHLGGINTVSWSPSGRLVASGGRDRQILVWESSTGELVRSFKGHEAWVLDLNWLDDDRHLISRDANGICRAWDIDASDLPQRMEIGSTPAWTWSKDGFAILRLDQVAKRLEAVNVLTNEHVRSDTLSLEDLRAACFGDRANVLATQSVSGKTSIWDIQSLNQPILLASVEIPPNEDLLSVDPFGRYLVTRGRAAEAPWSSAGIGYAVWTCEDGSKPISTRVGCRGTAWSPDGKTLLVGEAWENIQVWRLPQGESVKSVPAGNWVAAIAWDPNGSYFAAGGWDQVVYLRNSADTALITTLGGHNSGIEAVAWSPDGKRLATCDSSKIRIWNPHANAEILAIESPKIKSLSWSPNGRFLAAESLHALWIYDANFQVGDEILTAMENNSDVTANDRGLGSTVVSQSDRRQSGAQ